jgi:hypothetical protein
VCSFDLYAWGGLDHGIGHLASMSP